MSKKLNQLKKQKVRAEKLLLSAQHKEKCLEYALRCFRLENKRQQFQHIFIS